MKQAIFNFSRFVFGACACMLLIACAMYSFGVPAELPQWRYIVGFAFLGAAALVFERFVNTDDHAPNAKLSAGQRREEKL